MTGCAETQRTLHGLLDNELDAANAQACEEHLRHCAECNAAFREQQALQRAMRQEAARHAAPEALRARILADMDRATGHPGPRRRLDWRAWAPGVSGLALAASLALFVMAGTGRDDVTRDLVAGHVRSLMADHLTDVETSDRHVVKPWFAGRVDFSPPVVELAGAGFPLVGGRLDYVAGRPSAALVYRRDRHVINLFVWPDAAAADRAPDRAARVDGYNVLRWAEGGLRLSAVSDVEAGELRAFAEAFMREAGRAATPRQP
jgi:anti-sigma factor RsiW